MFDVIVIQNFIINYIFNVLLQYLLVIYNVQIMLLHPNLFLYTVAVGDKRMLGTIGLKSRINNIESM